MSVILKELFRGRRETIEDDAPEAEIAYVVTGAANEDEVKAAALAGIPAFLGELERKTVTIEDRLAPTIWAVTARFEKASTDPGVQSVSNSTSAFNIATTTKHLTQSLETLGKYGPKAKDLKGVIDFDGKEVRGVDVVEPTLTFSLSQTWHSDLLDATIRALFTSATGATNSRSFQGFAAGEVLFLGMSIQTKYPKSDMTFNYAVRSTVPAATVGSIAVPARPGWSYQWVQYAERIDGGQLVRVPVAVYVERVYPEFDLNLLGGGSL